MKQNLNDEDTFLLIVNAMNSSHNSYGIRPIQEEELRSLIRSFSQWRFNMALNMTLQLLSESPRQYMTLNSTDIENNFYLQSRFKQQIQRSKEYGETILDTFRSKKAIELSKSYRMEFKSLQERTSESYAWVREKSQISQKLQDLVVNQLRQEHPELNTTIKSWNSKNFKAPKTLAEVLWMAMSQPRSLYS